MVEPTEFERLWQEFMERMESINEFVIGSCLAPTNTTLDQSSDEPTIVEATSE